jgi:hypothetical protein
MRQLRVVATDRPHLDRRCGQLLTEPASALRPGLDGSRKQPIELLDLARAPDKSHRITVADLQRTLASAAARAVSSALVSPAAKCSSMAAR